tara:strand:+ start:722 stop:964 length:243 start_codon:yes stop_codon:yes gene_type:complete
MRAIACPRVGDETMAHATLWFNRDVPSRSHAQPLQIAYPVAPKVRQIWRHASGVTGGQATARRLRLDSGLDGTFAVTLSL